MTDEAAKACWFSAEAHRQDNRPKPVWGKDRTFESVDEAVSFVMEELSFGDGHWMITRMQRLRQA